MQYNIVCEIQPTEFHDLECREGSKVKKNMLGIWGNFTPYFKILTQMYNSSYDHFVSFNLKVSEKAFLGGLYPTFWGKSALWKF